VALYLQWHGVWREIGDDATIPAITDGNAFWTALGMGINKHFEASLILFEA